MTRVVTLAASLTLIPLLVFGEALPKKTLDDCITEKASRQARENLELAEGRYATGVGNIIELTDAQASLASAEANQVQSLVNYRIAVATLERATAQPVD